MTIAEILRSESDDQLLLVVVADDREAGHAVRSSLLSVAQVAGMRIAADVISTGDVEALRQTSGAWHLIFISTDPSHAIAKELAAGALVGQALGQWLDRSEAMLRIQRRDRLGSSVLVANAALARPDLAIAVIGQRLGMTGIGILPFDDLPGPVVPDQNTIGYQLIASLAVRNSPRAKACETELIALAVPVQLPEADLDDLAAIFRLAAKETVARQNIQSEEYSANADLQLPENFRLSLELRDQKEWMEEKLAELETSRLDERTLLQDQTADAERKAEQFFLETRASEKRIGDLATKLAKLTSEIEAMAQLGAGVIVERDAARLDLRKLETRRVEQVAEMRRIRAENGRLAAETARLVADWQLASQETVSGLASIAALKSAWADAQRLLEQRTSNSPTTKGSQSQIVADRNRLEVELERERRSRGAEQAYLRAENARLKAECGRLFASSSWRVTAPLRQLRRAIKPGDDG